MHIAVALTRKLQFRLTTTAAAPGRPGLLAAECQTILDCATSSDDEDGNDDSWRSLDEVPVRSPKPTHQHTFLQTGCHSCCPAQHQST